MKNSKLEIIGAKVFLRYIAIEDFEEFIELNKKSIEFYKGLASPILDFENFKTLVDKNLDEANECLAICQNIDNKIVGMINLTQIFRRSFQNAYLGYSLGLDFTGNGFMTEAVKLILQYSFENLRLHRIEANVQPHNLASIKVLERCGFRKEGFSRKYLQIDGIWCDHERWAIIVEDWELNNK